MLGDRVLELSSLLQLNQPSICQEEGESGYEIYNIIVVAVTGLSRDSYITQFGEDNKYIECWSQNSEGSEENGIIK